MSFRSEEMALCQFFFLSDVAYSCVSELGELGLVQFKDLNGNKVDFERKFVNEVRRCAEMERIFVYLKTQINRYGIAARKFREHTNLEAPHPKEMVDLEAILENLEYEIQNDNKNTRTLENNYMKLFELKHILQKNDLLDEISRQDSSSEDELQSTSELLSEEGKRDGKGFKFCFFVGVINQDRMQAFEKMIWRISLGNTFFRQSPISERIQNLETDVYEYKSAFIIIFQGEILKKKIETICKGFRASLYPCPEKAVDRRNMSINVMERLHELNTILKQTLEHRTRVLKATANNINEWTIKVKKMKAIFVTLNKFEANMTDKCFIGEGWVPVRYMDTIHLALQQAAMRSGSSMRPILTRIETDSTPPTYHKTNKFTAGFQALIDSYGIGTYQEINPTPFTIITFPFLFAIMFGDIGHGSILFLFASWMCLYEKRLIKQDIRNEVWEYFFGGRYIILLMGIFSIYTGFIYNDLFSKSLNIFGTSWSVNVTNIIGQSKTMKSNETITLNPATSEYYGSPYVLGMDPIWEIADNKILFHNSFKMKISIIVGIFQMLFGVFLSLLNYL